MLKILKIKVQNGWVKFVIGNILLKFLFDIKPYFIKENLNQVLYLKMN